MTKAELVEKIHAKAGLRISTSAVFFWRGWITQAALLKTAHRAVFAPSSATGPQLFESTRMKTQTFCKQKTASVSLR